MTDGRPAIQLVLVPDVRGLVVDGARAAARAAGVELAQPDADWPPLAALTWRLPVTVVSQDPPPGTPVRRYASVVVTWSRDGAGVREPRRPMPPSVTGAEDGER